MAATTSPSSCGGFFNLRVTSEEPEARVGRGSPACGKVDGVAMWLINSVSTAFFASLDRCSCIRIATVDDCDDANEVPLIFNDGNFRPDAPTCARRRTRKEKSKGRALIE